jgi:DNA-binding response OmpR family regulator
LPPERAIPFDLPPAPRILVVEDMREIAHFYVDILQSNGFAVNRAFDGLSGLRLARLIRPDLVLLNQMMPGMDGLRVLAALRSAPETARIKVIMTSAIQMRELALKAGAVDFIEVPFQVKELPKKITLALRR